MELKTRALAFAVLAALALSWGVTFLVRRAAHLLIVSYSRLYSTCTALHAVLREGKLLRRHRRVRARLGVHLHCALPAIPAVVARLLSEFQRVRLETHPHHFQEAYGWRSNDS
jgi:hypothetical protein